MHIRPFQIADLPTLKAITVAAFAGVSIDEGIEREFGPINGHNWQWRKAGHLDDDLNRPAAAVFVAEEAGLIAGYVSTWQDRDAGIGQIPNLAVSRFSRQRAGETVARACMAHFRASGLTHAKIETLAQNEVGNHLYRSLGFREVARQVHFVAEL